MVILKVTRRNIIHPLIIKQVQILKRLVARIILNTCVNKMTGGFEYLDIQIE